jgi:serine/threonine-protein kinase
MDPSQLQPGYRLDRYELLCPLAYGGMASVWLARFGGRLGFERLVVIKMILPQYSQDPRFQEMFLDEARIASRIEHANVARILDVGEHDGSYFMVMEWVDGDSLSKILRTAEHRKMRMPAGIALRICADAAAGLHAAHELQGRDGQPLGVVHRDVSPQNILVANSGATMVIDFGVAKARDRVSQETSAGQLKGKVRYMAPEQAVGSSLDRRADLWSLGAVLFELIAGVPPYDGPNEIATLHKLTSGQKPAPLPPNTPAPLRAVIERALAFSSEHRYATALEMNLALEAAMLDIGEATSMAVVGAFTAQLLVERKQARRRAVDAALDNARTRDVAPGASGSGAAAGGHHGVPMTHPLPTVLAAAGDDRVGQASPYDGFVPRAPTSSSAAQGAGYANASRPNSMSPFGLAEAPSANSQTLGSAALAFQPGQAEETRRKTMVAVGLGVVMAGALIGTFLVVRSVMLGSVDEGRTNASGSGHVQTGSGRTVTAPTTGGSPLPPGVMTTDPPPGYGGTPIPGGGVLVGATHGGLVPPPNGVPVTLVPPVTPADPTAKPATSEPSVAPPHVVTSPKPPVTPPQTPPKPPPVKPTAPQTTSTSKWGF